MLDKYEIKVALKNGYYYKGYIISEDKDYLIIRDIHGIKVTIRKDHIDVREDRKDVID